MFKIDNNVWELALINTAECDDDCRNCCDATYSTDNEASEFH